MISLAGTPKAEPGAIGRFIARHKVTYYGQIFLIAIELLVIGFLDFAVKNYLPAEMGHYVSLDVFYCLPVIQTARLAAINATGSSDSQIPTYLGVALALAWSATELSVSSLDFPVGAFVLNAFSRSVVFTVIGRVVTRLWRVRTSERRLKTLAYGTSEGVAISANGKFLDVNDQLTRILGFERRELIGRKVTDIIPDEDRDRVLANIMEGSESHIDHEVFRKDGSRAIVETHSQTVDQGGQSVRVTAVSDITERRKVEKLLKAAKEEAERANLAKSEFLSSMSHELRTPLNAILGFAQLMQLDEELSEEHKNSLQAILKSGHHLLELINDVLDLAKIESGHIDLSLEPVRVRAITDECLKLVSPLAVTHGIKLGNRATEGMAVTADRTRLKQALLNLLSNAIKYNREGGSVTIETRFAGKERLIIDVIDTGNGISEDRMHELFQPFNRLTAAKSSIEGTGIGLTITRRIVEMMGGSVDARSEFGVGSTFWIELPLDQVTGEYSGQPRKAEQNVAEPPHAATALHAVLYIEDNPSNLELVALILGKLKQVHLLTAHAPELGIELAQAHLPELILLDINLPRMNGYQVLQVLKGDSRTRDIPVVAISANAMPRDLARYREAGFTDYITKPFDVRQLMSVVENMLSI